MLSLSVLGIVYLGIIAPKMIPPAWAHLSARSYSLSMLSLMDVSQIKYQKMAILDL